MPRSPRSAQQAGVTVLPWSNPGTSQQFLPFPPGDVAAVLPCVFFGNVAAVFRCLPWDIAAVLLRANGDIVAALPYPLWNISAFVLSSRRCDSSLTMSSRECRSSFNVSSRGCHSNLTLPSRECLTILPCSRRDVLALLPRPPWAVAAGWSGR